MADKKIFVFFSYLLFLVLVSLGVNAIGISPADVYVNFVPGYEYVIDYSITGYRAFNFYTEGPFSEYTTVETISQSETQGNFRVHLKLPQDYSVPGKHRMYVAAKEKPIRGTVNTIAGIRGFIEIDVPFPGYYAEVDLSANDVNVGEPIYLTATVKNRGKENFTGAKLVLSVLIDDKVVKTIESAPFAVEAAGDYVFESEIAGNELKPGRYTLRAELSYAGNTAKKDIIFNVGTFDVIIGKYTERLYNGSVNPFEIEVKSRWNNRIDTVYMDLSIMAGTKALSTVKTPPFDLLPFETKKSSLYWNTESIPVGEYVLNIVLHYNEGTKTENGKVFIVEKEMPKTTAWPTSTIILVLIAIILVAFNIYFIMARKKDKKDDKE